MSPIPLQNQQTHLYRINAGILRVLQVQLLIDVKKYSSMFFIIAFIMIKILVGHSIVL